MCPSKTSPSSARQGLLALALLVCTFTGCGGELNGETLTEDTRMMTESTETQGRVDELRARFVTTTTTPHGATPAWNVPVKTVMEPVLGASAATLFELRAGQVRPVIGEGAKRAVARSATLTLPFYASDPVRIEDDASHLAVSFTLRGARSVGLTVGRGLASYLGAFGGADVLHRVRADGTEDYVVFVSRPEREELAYDVDVTRAPGLRLVSGILEFVDATGTPRLRVAPPYVVDALGGMRAGTLEIEGCTYDSSPKAPWGRSVTSPGAPRCTVRVGWTAPSYPVMVDPSWTTTGSMSTARSLHSATLLKSGAEVHAPWDGDVLIAGGFNYFNEPESLNAAELYHPPTRAFAMTGSMKSPRHVHTATLLGSGKVLVAGGYDVSAGMGLSSAELYDPAEGTFAQTLRGMGTSRWGHTATRLPTGDVLLAGGMVDSMGTCTTSAELYTPQKGGFVLTTGSMKTPRGMHTATLLATGDVLVAGGIDGPTSLSSAETYDVDGGTFEVTGSMLAARYNHAAVPLGSGLVLLTGGFGLTTLSGAPIDVLSSAEVYEPTSRSFSTTGAMTAARATHTASPLDTGEVLVSGGFGDIVYDTTSTAELYDPDGGTFRVSRSMAIGRATHAATELTSGEVLVTGGFDGLYNIQLSSAEVFDLEGDAGSDVDSGALDSGGDAGRPRKDAGMGVSDSGSRTDVGHPAADSSFGCGCHVVPSSELPAGFWFVIGAGCAIAVCKARRRWDERARFHEPPRQPPAI